MLVAAHAWIHEDRKLDTLLLDEVASPTSMSAADRDQLCSRIFYLIQSLSEASSLLAAEHSTEVAEEGDDCGLALHQLFELDDLVVEGLDCYHVLTFPSFAS